MMSYGLYDLGAASWLGSTPCGNGVPPPCATAHQAVHDVFAPVIRLLGEPPNHLTDLVSLVYTSMALGGCVLPWQHASLNGDVAGAIGGRVHVAEQPDHPCLMALPGPVRSFARDVLAASSAGKERLGSAAEHLTAMQQSLSPPLDSSTIIPPRSKELLAGLGDGSPIMSTSWQLPVELNASHG